MRPFDPRYSTSLKLISMTNSKNIMNIVSAFTAIAFGFGIGLGTGLFVSNLEEKLPRRFRDGVEWRLHGR